MMRQCVYIHDVHKYITYRLSTKGKVHSRYIIILMINIIIEVLFYFTMQTISSYLLITICILSNFQSTLKAKRQELQDKLEDAKLLKDGIDRRSKQVSVFLQRSLTGDEYEDYLHFIKMKSKLIVDQQEIDDKLKLGDGQLTALKKSMNLTDC